MYLPPGLQIFGKIRGAVSSLLPTYLQVCEHEESKRRFSIHFFLKMKLMRVVWIISQRLKKRKMICIYLYHINVKDFSLHGNI